jgi:lipoate-protein ligase A
MSWDILPTRRAGAAENMAQDFLLLQRYPGEARGRFRHYEWTEPAFTFGYSQTWEWVASQLPEGRFDLCRRFTGGGLVDHREDWTYALAVPRGHRLEEMRATQSYRQIHEALAGALVACGGEAEVKAACEPAEDGQACGIAGVCFQGAELYDVVSGSGAKIAGAAQKRSKHGLCVQGSVWKPAAGIADWDGFEEAFLKALEGPMGAAGERRPMPEFAEGELDGLSEQYRSEEWLKHR